MEPTILGLLSLGFLIRFLHCSATQVRCNYALRLKGELCRVADKDSMEVVVEARPTGKGPSGVMPGSAARVN